MKRAERRRLHKSALRIAATILTDYIHKSPKMPKNMELACWELVEWLRKRSNPVPQGEK